MGIRGIAWAALVAVMVAEVIGVAVAHAEDAAPEIARFRQSADEATLTGLQLLGKRVFEDTALSEPRGQACASCHDPKHAFQGNNGSGLAVAKGAVEGRFGVRKVPTLMYKAFSPPFGFYMDVENGKKKLQPRGGQFWDGRAGDLAEQVTGPLLNPVEMNNPSISAVVAKVKAGPYADLARTVAGPAIFDDDKTAMTALAKAVAAFEGAERFQPFSSKFDDYLQGRAKLSAEEARGLQLFVDPKKGNCVACHDGAPQSNLPTNWLFTDFTYDTLGVPRNGELPNNKDPKFYDLGLCKQPGIEAHLPASIPLGSLCGAFKVPTLRNVAVSGPYYHNGGIKTLREAVAFYVTRDTLPRLWYPRDPRGRPIKVNDLPADYRNNINTVEVPYDRKPGQTPRLNEREIDAIVAFLKTLTDKGME